MTDAPIPIRPTEEAGDSPASLYVDDRELHRLISRKMGFDRFCAAIADAEKRGFPRIRAVWGGRYWPKCKEWLDIENGVGNHDVAATVEDGPENFDAATKQNARPQARASSAALLDRAPSRARPDGVSGAVHRLATRR